MKNKTIAVLLLIWIIIVASTIFWFSSKSGKESGDMSQSITDEIFELLETDEESKKQIHFLVRKAAHVAEFGILGASICVWLFFMSDAGLINVGSYPLMALISWVLTTLYAVTDEIHQIFVPDRGPAVGDVLIDSAGALIGICIVLTIGFRIENRKEKIRNLKLSDRQQNGD